ncbi:MAG: hypothetical protein MRY63_13635 [Neomegalonema sp.]|nr:hypothetical protein [Neomegalonema sp.]
MYDIARQVDRDGKIIEEAVLSSVAARSQKEGDRWLVLVDRGAPLAHLTDVLDAMGRAEILLAHLNLSAFSNEEALLGGNARRPNVRLAKYATIDPEFDDQHYDEASQIAESYADALATCFDLREELRPYIGLRDALFVRLLDTMSGPLRGIRFMDGLVRAAAGEPVQVLLISGTQAFLPRLAGHFADALERPVWVAAPVQAPVLQALSLGQKLSDFKWLLTLAQKRWRGAHVQKVMPSLARTHRIVFANLASRPYFDTAQLLGDALREQDPTLVLTVREAVGALFEAEPALGVGSGMVPAPSALGPIREPGRVERLPTSNIAPVHPSLAQTLHDAAQRADEALALGEQADIRRFVLSTAAAAIPTFLPFALRLFDDVMAAMRAGKISSVIVTPGRQMEARILVHAAQLCGIAQIDVQAVMFSASGRYLAPSAEHATAMDGFSEALLIEHFGMAPEQVTLMGSPRLDHSVAQVLERNDPAEAIEALLALGIKRFPVMMFASQTVPSTQAQQLARVVFDGCAEFGPCSLLLKPHPNESLDNDAAYRAMAASYAARGVEAVLTREADLYQMILAVDLVGTYFSNVGLEAFAAGRPVVAVDPFEMPPPFDLAAVGAATTVTDGEALSGLMAELFAPHYSAYAEATRAAQAGDGRAVLAALAPVRAAMTGESAPSVLRDRQSLARFVETVRRADAAREKPIQALLTFARQRQNGQNAEQQGSAQQDE